MELSFPSYYRDFRCIADACPDSCCKDWAVQIDDVSASRYRELTGDLGNDLRACLQEEDGDTILTLTADGRCPMWQENRLCRIHAQLGQDWLCNTCREFPRLRHEYGSFTELGLELSCPEAARLILTSEGHSFVTETTAHDELPDYDTDAMQVLRQSRKTVLDFLNTTTMPIGEALAVVLLYGYAVQDELDGGEPAQLRPEDSLTTARSIAVSDSGADLLQFFTELEILTPQWRDYLRHPAPAPWQHAYRALATYFIERYWLQAVSDYDLVGRVKLCVIACLVTKLVGGDLIQTAQLFSKEIENNTDNVYAILDGAYTSPALADVHLLGMLLEK